MKTRTYTIITGNDNAHVVGRVRGPFLPKINQLETAFRKELNLTKYQDYVTVNGIVRCVGKVFIQWLVDNHGFVEVDTDTHYM